MPAAFIYRTCFELTVRPAAHILEWIQRFMKKWFVVAKKADFQKISEEFHISPVIARIIRNRDITEMDDIRKYLYGTKKDFYDPFLLSEMDKAVKTMWTAIKEKKKVRVIGDYDADGICSSYILEKAIREAGGNVDVVIPHRMKDGYGLNDSLILQAATDGVDLIITCDNGISAKDQIALAYENHMQVIVTDHHEVPFIQDGEEKIYQIPKAEAVVDPKKPGDTYPFPGICGAFVAYKFAEALWKYGNGKYGNKEYINKEYINKEYGNETDGNIQEKELEEQLDGLMAAAAFATICDVMELLDENRILVKEGLERIRKSKHPGIKALIQVNGLEPEKIDAYHIGFVLGPCLNASGRLESAMWALRLLQEQDYGKAVVLATELKQLNDSRKEMTEHSVKEAQEQIQNLEKLDKILVLYLPECHESLAGIVAGRIREKYNRPTIVLTRGEEGIKGSGRSIEEYDMYVGLSACRELFDKFGGHKMAAGLSMQEENVDLLRTRLNEACKLTEEDFIPKVHIDVPMPISYTTEEFVKELKLLEPFGVGNPKPVFAQKEVLLQRVRVVGKHCNVAKMQILDDRGERKEMVYYGDVPEFKAFLEQKYPGDTGMVFSSGMTGIPVTMTYYPSVNEYRGERSIQLVMTNYC